MAMGIELDTLMGIDSEQAHNPDTAEVSGLLTGVIHDFVIETIASLVSVDQAISGTDALADEIDLSRANEREHRTNVLINLVDNLVSGIAAEMNAEFKIRFSIDRQVLSQVPIKVQEDLSVLSGIGEGISHHAGYFCYWMSELQPIKIQLPADILQLIDKIAIESEDIQRLHYCFHESDFQKSLQFPINEYVSIFASLMLMNSATTDRNGSPFYFADADKLDDFVKMLSQSDLGRDGVRIILEILFENLLASYARPLDCSN